MKEGTSGGVLRLFAQHGWRCKYPESSTPFTSSYCYFRCSMRRSLRLSSNIACAHHISGIRRSRATPVPSYIAHLTSRLRHVLICTAHDHSTLTKTLHFPPRPLDSLLADHADQRPHSSPHACDHIARSRRPSFLHLVPLVSRWGLAFPVPDLSFFTNREGEIHDVK